MATKGCYLEVINRAFDSITVTCTNSNKNDWEPKKSPQELYNNRVLDEKNYYGSEDAEMDGIFQYDGKFTIYITIDKNPNVLKQTFNLKDGKNNITTRNRYIFSDQDCMLLVTKGHSVKRFDSLTKANADMGVFKIEVFSLSKRRFGVIADYHLNDERTEFPPAFIYHLKKIQYTPEFIAVCGDLVDNSTKMAQDLQFARNFIIPFEDDNFMIAEGFGNHDNWISPGGTDMPRFIEGRNIERWKEKYSENKLNEFSYDNLTQYKERHYTWTSILEKKIGSEIKKVKIHFFMLNTVPGYEVITEMECDDDKQSQKNSNSPYESLTYLEKTLATINPNDGFKHVAILFFHINHDASPKWWSDRSKQNYRTVCYNSKIDVLASFFGHIHSHETISQPMTGIVDNGSTYTIKGFKCATELLNNEDSTNDNYKNYITFVDNEITDKGKLEMKVSYLEVPNTISITNLNLKIDDSSFTEVETLTFDI